MNIRNPLQKLLLVPLLLACFCTSARAFYDASVGNTAIGLYCKP